MKIQEFCSKIRREDNSLFQTLRRLQEIDTQTLLDSDSLQWHPWTPGGGLIDPETVSA